MAVWKHPVSEMSDADLREALPYWETAVENSTGFPSAFEAAKALKLIVNEANKRGMSFTNRFPIRRG